MMAVLIATMRRVFRETFPTVIGATIGELLAGLVLGGMEPSLQLLPGLIVLVPAVLDLRGCISSALGSRLGSALHLGFVGWKKGMNSDLRANVEAALLLSVLTATFIGFLAFTINQYLGIPTISAFGLVLISLLSGFLAATSQISITVLVSFTSFSRGIDPDNVTIPIMATVGDILGITYLFIVTALLGGILV